MNTAEDCLRNELEEQGWKILKKGWPDFACFRGTEFMVIEVKSHYSHRLKSEQRKLLLKFAEFGVPSYRWTPDTGLEQVTAEMRMESTPNKERSKKYYDSLQAQDLEGMKVRKARIRKTNLQSAQRLP